jgi:hypothetical protein
MPVTYLSQEWIDAYSAALAGDAVMQLRGPLAQVQTALAGIDTEY